MPPATLPRAEILDRLLSVFRRYGYEGASLSRISDGTGLGRSSLYHHFPGGKDDMASAILAHTEAASRDHIVGPLLAPGTPRERVERLAAGLDAFYAQGTASCLVELFGIGEAGDRFGETLHARVSALIRLLADVAVQSGLQSEDAAIRAEDAIVAVQGALVVSRVLGSTRPFRRVLDRLPELLLGAGPIEAAPVHNTGSLLG